MIHQITDKLRIHSNVRAVLRNESGRVVDVRESHNVFTNNGRQWLRNLVGARSYPSDASANTNLTGITADGTTDSRSVTSSQKTFRVRYIGVGVGGVGQTSAITGYVGPGTYVEEVTVQRLERPVKVTSTAWLKQVLAQDTLSDTQTFVDSYTIRFRAIFGKDDISFTSQPNFVTNVPITEVGLFTSEAGRDVDPTGSGGDNGKQGFIAYNTFSPIHKTPNFTLEIGWSLLF